MVLNIVSRASSVLPGFFRGSFRGSFRGACILLAVFGNAGITNVSAADATAVDTSADLTLDSNTEIVLEIDANGLPAKSKMIATPSFFEYALNPVVDGIKNRKELNWQMSCWASAEEEEVHGIEMHLSQPRTGGRFQITWAFDIHNANNGRWWISQNYTIQTKNAATGTWKTAADVKGNQSIVSSHQLPNEPFRFVRIVQPIGGGHPDRPNIMWVSQVELLDF